MVDAGVPSEDPCSYALVDPHEGDGSGIARRRQVLAEKNGRVRTPSLVDPARPTAARHSRGGPLTVTDDGSDVDSEAGSSS